MSRISSRLAVFAITLVLVVIISSGGGPVLSTPSPSVSHPEYDADQLVPEKLDRSDAIDVPTRNQQKIIVIDKSHVNRIPDGDLASLKIALTSADHHVVEIEDQGAFQSTLAQADALILMDPALGYTAQEVTAIESFVESGGRLLILGEPKRNTVVSGQLATRQMRFGGLLDRLDVSFGSTVYDMQQNDGNFRHVIVNGTNTAPGPPLRSAVLYTAATITLSQGDPVLMTHPTARTDRDQTPGPHTVAAVRDNVFVVGDASFIRDDAITIAGNARLGSAITAFLVEGRRDRGVENYPFYISRSPTIHFTWDRLLPAATTLGSDLRAHGFTPDATLKREALTPQQTDVLITTFDYLRDHPDVAKTAGVRLKNDTVRAGDMQTTTPGVVVIRAPRTGFDLVIAGDTPERSHRATEVLVDPSENQWAWDRAPVNKRTLVFTGDPSTVIGL